MNPELINAAVARFSAELESFEGLAAEVARIVRESADRRGIKCSVTWRAKDPKSFHKKIIAKRYFESPYEQVTDKIGVRVVVHAPQDVDRLTAALRADLEDRWLRSEDKREPVDPKRLDYSGVHVQVLSRSEELGEVECEVQLRTAAQDAWSVISHQFLYKPLLSLPPLVQHRAYRLVALVEMFDEEVQRLVDAAESAIEDDVEFLLRTAGDAFLRLVHAESNMEFSSTILQAIVGAFTDEELRDYDALLGAFIESERVSLEALYSEYGPHSPLSYSPEYVLFSQAESLVVLERLSVKPHMLAGKWRANGLPETYLDALASAAGVFLPE